MIIIRIKDKNNIQPSKLSIRNDFSSPPNLVPHKIHISFPSTPSFLPVLLSIAVSLYLDTQQDNNTKK